MRYESCLLLCLSRCLMSELDSTRRQPVLAASQSLGRSSLLCGKRPSSHGL